MAINLGIGAVLGIDVGYSPKKPTTCFCLLEWNRSTAKFQFRVTTADTNHRRRAIVDLVGAKQLCSVALDGPLTQELRTVSHYRAAEAILSRGVLQKRGKPGPTSSPVGRQLHKHATKLAKLALDTTAIASSTHWEPIHEKRIVEAFPNMFLAALIHERNLPSLARDASDRYWEMLVEKSERMLKLLEYLLPGRRLECDLRGCKNHDRRAGIVCGLTALSMAAGHYVAVGDPVDGDIVLPPRSMWGSAMQQSGAWLESVLCANVVSVRQSRRAHLNHKRARIIRNGAPWGELNPARLVEPATEALEDHRAGRTEPLDPDRL